MRTHSYSSLKAWVTCPRQYKALYIDKSVRRTSSPALERGNRIHQALEDAVNGGAEPDVWTPDGLIHKLSTGSAEAEVELAIRRDGTPCGFWDKDAWLRGKIDVYMGADGRALMIDWKTGKVYPDALQADIYATMARCTWGSDMKVSFYFVYVDQKVIHPEYPDSHAEERVRALVDRVEGDEHYTPQPCFACRFCPVNWCEYNDAR